MPARTATLLAALRSAFWAGAAWALAACAPAPAPAASEPALWRIADADSEIWLYGSVHVLPPELEWRGPRFEAAFAAAEEVVLEVDASENFDALMAQYGTLPAGEALSGLLDAPSRARLARIAQELRVDPATLARARPWLAAVWLSVAYAEAHGHTAAAGVDAVLEAQARASGKRLAFLETPEQQIRVLAELSLEDELRFLAVTLREIDEGADSLAAIDAAWVRGDVETLAALLDAQWREAGPGIHDALIVRRNRSWTAEIARRLDGSGRVFYAVGAAHLVGRDSVVAMLRARGIEVEGP